MGLDTKRALKIALSTAITAAELTPNIYDDIIVKSACAILSKVFKLGDI